MSIPNQKRPKPRGKKQRAQYVRNKQKKLLERVKLTPCLNCGEIKLSHAICKECGAYKPRKVTKKEEEKAATTKSKKKTSVKKGASKKKEGK